MAEVSNKMLDKFESVKQNDHAMRNLLIVGLFALYLGLVYIVCLFMTLFTMTITGAGFFAVIKTAILKVPDSRTVLVVLTIALIIGETCLFMLFKGLKPKEEALFEYADNGNYGSSQFLKEEEYNQFLGMVDCSTETDGIILGRGLESGKTVFVRNNDSHNRNFFVCGSQGTSKSIAFSRTMIMQCAMRGESVFVTDPKGELYKDMAMFLKFLGYNVYQWNLVNRYSSDGWDILKEVHGDEEYEYVDILVNTIIANTGGKESGDFFDNIESVLLKALILYVLARYPEKDQNFGSVYNLIAQKSSEELDELFATLVNAEDYAGRLAYSAYNLFAKSQTNKGNAILGLGSRLTVFSTDVVQKMLSSPDIQIESLGQEKTAIFCIASDSTGTYAVLNALLTSIVFIKLMAYADRIGGKCKVPVMFILDEFVNIGAIPDFTKKLATARSRDIGMTVIVQNIPQLRNRYPDGQAEEIIGGCDFSILLGANDQETAEYFSDLVGMTTIKVQTDRRSVTNNLFTMTSTELEGNSEGSGQRSLSLPEEIRRMNENELLLLIRGKQPIKLKKYQYFLDPNSLLLRECIPADVIPDWAVEKGIYMRTKKPIEETREQMEYRIMRDPNAFVVKDSKRWGPQRTELIQILKKAIQKNHGGDYFPNGMPVSVFDSFVLGGEIPDYENDESDTEEHPKYVLGDRSSSEIGFRITMRKRSDSHERPSEREDYEKVPGKAVFVPPSSRIVPTDLGKKKPEPPSKVSSVQKGPGVTESAKSKVHVAPDRKKESSLADKKSQTADKLKADHPQGEKPSKTEKKEPVREKSGKPAHEVQGSPHNTKSLVSPVQKEKNLSNRNPQTVPQKGIPASERKAPSEKKAPPSKGAPAPGPRKKGDDMDFLFNGSKLKH